ncbi:MAG: DUF6443 domain-containing protein [Bacteroidota bacterium]
MKKRLLITTVFTLFTVFVQAQFTFYRDNDGDSLGGSQSISSSYPPPGYVANNADCNDNDSSIGRATTWYRDADGDGLGNPNVSLTRCTRPNGYVSNDDDLDDSDGNINDTGPWYFYYDNDGDGYGTGTNFFYGSYPPPGYVSSDGDCNDNNGNINPGRPEICGDGLDNNCNGQFDENDPLSPPLPTTSSTNFCGTLTVTRADPPSGVTYYWQTGLLGESTSNSAKTRTFTSGYQQYIYLRARNNQGCWGPPAVYIQYTVPQPPSQPGLIIKENNCGETILRRANPPSGVTYYWQESEFEESTANSSVSVVRTTGTTYYLRPKKNNVDCWGPARRIDYTIDAPPRWYVDNDGDGYGGNTSVQSCTQPSGYVSNNHDINDNDPNITDRYPWYRDADNDSYGNPSIVEYSLSPPPGYVSNDDDCNDGDPTLGLPPTWYRDADGDGLGDINQSVVECYSPNGYVDNSDDCNDSNPVAGPLRTWYLDVDGDGLGDPASGSDLRCINPVGYVLDNTDLCPNFFDPTNSCDTSSGNGAGDATVSLNGNNYILSRSYQNERSSPLTVKDASGNFMLNADLVQNVSYFDGVGRPMQQIAISQSPVGQKDIITHFGYDEFGRQEKEWLPVYVPNGISGSYRTQDMEAATSAYYKAHTDYGADFPTLTGSAVNAYSQKEFEVSPLNRLMKQAAPGESWAMGNGHEIGFSYETNIASDDVRQFAVDLSLSDNTYTPSLIFFRDEQNVVVEFYATGELFKTITYDENHVSGKNHSTEEYTNKEGQVVLKRTYADMDLNEDGDTQDAGESQVRHDTYYVYDDFGNLSFVLPPKMDASTGILSSLNSTMAALGYQYSYDHRNRLVIKQLPGKGKEYIIYNKLDQPIMTQDANQRLVNEWLFTKYDAFGRVAYTGKATTGNGITREQIQQEVDNLTNRLWVIQDNTSRNFGDAGSIYYDDAAYPSNNTSNALTSLTEVLTITYYDSYVDLPTGVQTTVPLLGSTSNETSRDTFQGLATVSKVKVLEVTPVKWITTVTHYDDKGRPIQTYTKNDYLSTVDIVRTQLDFVDRPIKVRSEHKRTQNSVEETVVTLDNFTYDPVGRLLTQTQCIGDENMGDSCPSGGQGNTVEANLVIQTGTVTTDQVATQSISLGGTVTVSGSARLYVDPNANTAGTVEPLAANTYDELGQLVEKEVGGGLQTVDYTYNVRGWLKQINDPSNLGDDLFAFGINYNSSSHSGTPLYNGNIAETEWRTANVDNTLKWYRYEYDALNRIRNAIGNNSNYDLVNVDYDRMGNIMALERRGQINNTATNFGVMDDLTYSYDTGNRLMKVSDAATVDQYGFKDDAVNTTADTSDDYSYDLNGNMKTDTNKGITSIAYNHLNLPISITMASGTISYIYDASGVKLEKNVTTGAKTEYCGNYVYQNGNLEFFNHPEGYVNASGSGYSFIYQYKDHLGNVRLSYTKDPSNPTTPSLIEENNYYPFGLKHKGYNMGGDTALGSNLAQNWKFGGKEYDESLGLETYDFGARNYNPDIGKWMNIDPLAEKYYTFSGYNYTMNNPVLYIDPDGMRVEYSDDLNKKENRARKREIRQAIRSYKRQSKTFRKLYRALHQSESVFTISEGQTAGHGTFSPAPKMIDDLDANGEPKAYDEIGMAIQKENPNTGGDITFDLDLIKSADLDVKDIIPEEFGHAYQYLHYTNGDIDNYSNVPPGGNYEYEGQMISGKVKNEANYRLSPDQKLANGTISGATRAAEKDGINFSKSNFGNNIQQWYNRSDNYYRTYYERKINQATLPSAYIKLNSND